MPRAAPRRPGWIAAALLVLLAGGCAGGADGAPSAGGPPPPSGSAPDRGAPDRGAPDRGAPPAADAELVLRVERAGGFLPVPTGAATVPLVSVYRDGRVIAPGPMPAIAPALALPNLQVRTIDPGAVPILVDRAVAAGVGESTDLGRPGIADAPTTTVTVVTDRGRLVRTVYALSEARLLSSAPRQPVAANGLDPEQQAARARLQGLVTALTDLDGTLGGRVVGQSRPYVPQAVAALVAPFAEGSTRFPSPEARWPGPPLPGAAAPGGTGQHCVTAAGEQATAVLAAAAPATAATPWISDDGRRWSVAFRPLMPDEHGCADLRAS